MNILMVNHFPLFGSGSGTYVRNIASHLSLMGNSVFVLAPDNTIREGFNFTLDTILCDDGSSAVRSIGNGEWDLPFNFPCFTTHPLSRVTFYELSEEQIVLYISVFRKKIEEIAGSKAIDIVLSQHLWTNSYIISQLGFPLIATCHGTDLIGYGRDARFAKYARGASSGASRVIAISEAVRREIKSIFQVMDEKVVKIFNGYDEEIFFPRPVESAEILKSLGIGEASNYVILFAGKLAHFKGADILLKAASLYEKAIPGAITLVAGMGDEYGALLAMKGSLGLKGLHFIGHVEQDELARLMSIADILVCPSRNEPFGLIPIEAMGCGTPVAASSSGAFPEFVSSGVGYLFESENPEALASTLISALGEDCRQKKGSAAYEYARSNFTWKEVAKKMEQIAWEVMTQPL